MHGQHEPDPRKEAIRDILTARYGADMFTEEEIDSVIAALDGGPSYDGWLYHPEIPRGGADPADIDY